MLQQALALQTRDTATGTKRPAAPASNPGYTSANAPYQEGTSTAPPLTSPLCALPHSDFPRRGQRTVLVGLQGAAPTRTLSQGLPLTDLHSLRRPGLTSATAGPSLDVPSASTGARRGRAKGGHAGGFGGGVGPPHSSEDLTAVPLSRPASAAVTSLSEPALPWPGRKRQQSFCGESPTGAKRGTRCRLQPLPPPADAPGGRGRLHQRCTACTRGGTPGSRGTSACIQWEW